MKFLATPVWVCLPNIPLQWIQLDFLEAIGNTLGHFVKIDKEILANKFISFICIFMELDSNKGLLDKISLEWDGKEYLQTLDYENQASRCRVC